MKITEATLKVSRTASYSTNAPDKPIKTAVFVIHGYAQLAREFITEFSFLDDGATLIVAPGGLSRFYSKSKIGASWMTKEQRVHEISDYVNYLDKLDADLSAKNDLAGADRFVLGFSQGVHTAVRWFTESVFDHSGLILCSSDFPADANFNKLVIRLGNGSIKYIQGKSDDITGMRTFEKSCALLESNSVPFTKIFFEGKHEINPDSVIEALKK